MLTVALDVPSARVLADQASIIQDLQLVMDSCKRLLAELARPEEERDGAVPQALWSSALLAYGRCFEKDRPSGLTDADIEDLPLHGAVMKSHTWVLEERDKAITYPSDPFAAAKVGVALSPLRHKQRRVEGIAIYATSHVLADAIGVRQLGGLASELAKQTAEKATKQQDVVLADARRQDLDSLYSLPPLRQRPPAGDAETDDPEAGDPAAGDPAPDAS